MPKGDFPEIEPSLPRPKKLLNLLRDATHTKHHSYSTKKTYVLQARRYFLFRNKRQFAEMGAIEI
jgi:hypothetical protein